MRLWIAAHKEDADLFDLVYAASEREARRILCTYGLFCEVPSDLVVVVEMTPEQLAENAHAQPITDPDVFAGRTVGEFAAEIAAREAEERRIAEFKARQCALPGVEP